ncbi:quinohemoprotein amine dehydrogenase subunit alpha [Sulfurimonas sp. HSL3-7]|uniref:quinohemoprotein amine dehydrogenase subunit alpha n=1 Tax=Sulfonitrofixus jiaomeiensis TaxID=3131938 RepID=UPI0031F867CD
MSSVPLFAAVDAKMGAEIINSKCTACHSGTLGTGLSRISDQRKSPEGWYMTISRMQRHGLDLTTEERMSAVKYLSDNQGLTPDELMPYVYVLDKTPNAMEEGKDELLTEMCVRCHSEARIGLQRRTADEWRGLVNFHVAQFISFEVQAQARDRDWFGVANNEIVPYLEANFGKDEKVWKAYQESIKGFELPLKWSVYGHTPGKGDFKADLTFTKNSDETYAVTMLSEYADGEKVTAEGTGIAYSGTEVRASLEQNGVAMQQIMHVNASDGTFTGRVYETLHNENGSYLKATAADKKETEIAGVYPKALKAGESTTLTIVGSNLGGTVSLNGDVKVLKTLKQNENEIVLEVQADKAAKTSQSSITIGSAVFENSFAVYEKVDYVSVTPDYAVSRTGSEAKNSKILKQYATFEAIGFSNGADGEQGTEDDVNLGVLPVTWNIEPFDEQAIKDKDVLYAGSINRYTGMFTPSEDGLNPKRTYSTNNVGNLFIVATYLQDDGQIDGKAHLIATVPKFVNPPIN